MIAPNKLFRLPLEVGGLGSFGDGGGGEGGGGDWKFLHASGFDAQ